MKRQKTKEHPEGIVLESTFFQQDFSGYNGVADAAGRENRFLPIRQVLCLATLANAGGKEYILITADAPGRNANSPFHIVDAVNVYENLTENCNS